MIADGIYEPGIYTYSLEASKISSGIYFLILEGEREKRIKRLVILR